MTSPPFVPASSSVIPAEALHTAPRNLRGTGSGVPAALAEYDASCTMHGVRPCQYFLELLRAVDTIVLIDFRGAQYLGDRGVACVAAALPGMPHLKLLSMADNGVTNTGLAALCDAIDSSLTQTLRVLDVHQNPGITRDGGQRLLNTAGRSPALGCCVLSGTRCSEYFELRIQRHVAQHYAHMSEADRGEVDALVIGLTWGGTGAAGPGGLRRGPGGHSSSPLSHSGMPGGSQRSGAESAFQVRLKSSASVMSPSRLFRNLHYDEAYEVGGDADDSDLDSEDCLDPRGGATNASAAGTAQRDGSCDREGDDDDDDGDDAAEVPERPLAPSAMETVLHAGTPDFLDVRQDGPYCITRLGRRRTVYRLRTPTGLQPLPEEAAEVLSFKEYMDFGASMHSFKPREIVLEAKFLFPGKIDYIAAVHAPDPMLAPPLPCSMEHLREAGDRMRLRLQLEAEGNSVNEQPSAAANDNNNDEEGDSAQTPTGTRSEGEQERPDSTSSPPAQPVAAPEGGGAASPTIAAGVNGSPPDSGMYWRFFQSAGRQMHPTPSSFSDRGATQDTLSSAAATSTRAMDQSRDIGAASHSPPWPRDPSQGILSAHDPPTVEFSLRRANDALCGNPALLSGRLTDPTGPASPRPDGSRPLTSLIDDPRWVPSRPTRRSQVDQYVSSRRLDFNTVRSERFSVTRAKAPREYLLHRVIRPSLTEKLTAGALNHSGTLIATSSYDLTCKLRCADTGRKIATLRGHEGHISECLFVGPSCETVLTASYDRTVKLWRVSDGELLQTLRGHTLEIVSLACSKDGRFAASGGMDDMAILWRLPPPPGAEDHKEETGGTGGEEHCTLSGHTGEVIAISFAPDASKVVTGGMDDTLRVWRVDDGTCLLELNGHEQEISHVSFNCFGNIILSGSADSTCRLWDVDAGTCKVLRGHGREVAHCAFSPNGWQCASVSDDHTVRIWDVLTGGCVTMITGHAAEVCHIAFNSDGTEILTGSVDMTARLWSVETGECLQVLKGHRSVVLVDYSGDSERIMTISKDNSVRVWKREPETNSLLHFAAVSICQHPTVYQEVQQNVAVPDHLQTLLQRVHRRVFLTEREAVATPLPAMETPCSVDGGGGEGRTSRRTSPHMSTSLVVPLPEEDL